MPDHDTSRPLTITGVASSEAGAWSNAYLLDDGRDLVLFDVPMLRSDASILAEAIDRTGSRLTTVFISHAHPDHFLASDVIADCFPGARFVSAPNVVADIEADGPPMLEMLRGRLGLEAPKRLVVPEPLETLEVELGARRFEVVEFGESEAKHIAALLISERRALLSADIVYHGAHLYLQERHLDSWLERLRELEAYASNRIDTLLPGHGAPGGLDLIGETRTYLETFAAALRLGDPAAAEARMLEAFPSYKVKQFLTGFSVPAYFPRAPGVRKI